MVETHIWRNIFAHQGVRHDFFGNAAIQISQTTIAKNLVTEWQGQAFSRIHLALSDGLSPNGDIHFEKNRDVMLRLPRSNGVDSGDPRNRKRPLFEETDEIVFPDRFGRHLVRSVYDIDGLLMETACREFIDQELGKIRPPDGCEGSDANRGSHAHTALAARAGNPERLG